MWTEADRVCCCCGNIIICATILLLPREWDKHPVDINISNCEHAVLCSDCYEERRRERDARLQEQANDINMYPRQ